MEFTEARVADLPTVQVSTWVNASPDRVWDVVSDITVMPETSTELQSVEWLDEGPVQVGSRFLGHSDVISARSRVASTRTFRVIFAVLVRAWGPR